MKILILHKYMVIGGIERVLLSYARLFNELNYNVDVLITYDISHYMSNLQADLENISNVSYVISKDKSKTILERQKNKNNHIVNKLLYEYGRLEIAKSLKKRIHQVFKDNHYDVIIDFSGVLDKSSYISSLNVPCIRWVHSELDIQNIIDKPKRYERFFKIIAINEEMLNRLKIFSTLSKEKFSLLYNPLNLDEINLKSLDEIDIHDDDYFITVSRLVKSKGIDRLIDIYADLKGKGIKNKLYILGDGEQKNDLQKKINALSLENDCYLLGNKLNPYPYLRKAKLFLFTSESEGFGMVIVESMACGTPAIVMDCPVGPKEILGAHSEYGKLIPLHDKTAFSSAVLELIENRELYQFYQDRGKVRCQDFSEERVKIEIQRLFNQILNHYKWNSKA